MAADLQYFVNYKSIGPIFNKLEIKKDSTVRILRETNDSTYSIEMDLYYVLDGALSALDFEIISEQLNHNFREIDEDTFHEILMDGYEEEEVETVISYEGDYREYIEVLGNLLLDNLRKYEYELEDLDVLVEVYL